MLPESDLNRRDLRGRSSRQNTKRTRGSNAWASNDASTRGNRRPRTPNLIVIHAIVVAETPPNKATQKSTHRTILRSTIQYMRCFAERPNQTGPKARGGLATRLWMKQVVAQRPAWPITVFRAKRETWKCREQAQTRVAGRANRERQVQSGGHG